MVSTQIQKLFEIAQKQSRNIIGLMSGTSMDGLDIAYCNISGAGISTKVTLLNFATIDYPSEVKEMVRVVFAKESIDFEYLTLLNAWLGSYHAGLINDFISKNKIDISEVDLIASHGQTVYHAPKILHNKAKWPNATLQIGDGDHIAVGTGIITISDFRQKHIAAGGEGAPLALYGDYFIFSHAFENRILLNIGGIANFTYLPAGGNAKQCFVTDTGPGNTLLDLYVRKHYPNLSFDKDSAIALTGKVNNLLLEELMENDFFKKPFPKTTGPELFGANYVENALEKLSLNNITIADLLATLTKFSAMAIARAIEVTADFSLNFNIYLSGGGAHNILLVRYLKELLTQCSFKNTADLGINPDAKEAILFAILANETLVGGQTNFGENPNIPSVSFGKISFPK